MTDGGPVQKPSGCAVVVGLFVIVMAAGAIIGAFTGDDDGDNREAAAFDVCKDFVKRQLRSPGSAEFRNYFEDDGEVVVTGTGDGPYVVRSTVDSQNGFGALLRSDFTCTVNYVGDGNWRLADIDVD